MIPAVTATQDQFFPCGRFSGVALRKPSKHRSEGFPFGASYAEGSVVAGRVPTFRSASDLPVPKAKVRSGVIRRARSGLQRRYQRLIRGSYLPLGHHRQVVGNPPSPRQEPGSLGEARSARCATPVQWSLENMHLKALLLCNRWSPTSIAHPAVAPDVLD